MQASQIWRSVLADILKRPGERKRIARALGIHPLTLTRWMKSQSNPSPRYLHQLLTILSEQQTVLRSLLATSSLTSDLWSIRKRILQQALEQLGPGRRSITITLMRCVPPATEHKVRSVQVMLGVGLPPWGGDVDQQLVFFGAESIAGRVVSTGRPVTIQSLHQTRLMDPPGIPGLGSLSVYPLQRAGRIAGTFNVLSSEPGYLLLSREALIQQYSNLLALTFAPEDCYALEDIHLHRMPPPPLQVPYLTRFRARVLEVLREAAHTQQSMTNAQAEQVIWHRIEEELVHLVLATKR